MKILIFFSFIFFIIQGCAVTDTSNEIDNTEVITSENYNTSDGFNFKNFNGNTIEESDEKDKDGFLVNYTIKQNRENYPKIYKVCLKAYKKYEAYYKQIKESPIPKTHWKLLVKEQKISRKTICPDYDFLDECSSKFLGMTGPNPIADISLLILNTKYYHGTVAFCADI